MEEKNGPLCQSAGSKLAVYPLGTSRQSVCVRVWVCACVCVSTQVGAVGQCWEPVHQLSLRPQKQQSTAKLITDTFRHSSWLANNPPANTRGFDVSCWGGSLNIRTYLCSTAVISFDFLVWRWCFSSICLWKQNISQKKKPNRGEEVPVRFAFVWYKLNSQIKRVYGFAMDLTPNH